MEAIEEVKEGIEPMLTRVELMAPIIAKLMSGEMKLSYTALSNFIDSPKDFADYKLQKKEPTKAMIYGSMVHCLVLEPADFLNRYYPLDDEDICQSIGGARPRATKKYAEWKALQQELANGKTIVSPQDYMHAKVVALNVTHNRAAARILKLCPHKEQPVEWEYLNFWWRGFIDMEGDEDIGDLKTMPDANRKKVDREIKNRKLYVQGVMYSMGSKYKAESLGLPWKPKNIHFIAVDKLGGICVYTLDKRLIEYGMQEYEHYVKKFNYAILTEAWDQSQDFYSDRWDGTLICEKSGYMFDAEF
jgi:PDDEXK-like domain of unknown function (DUF3799)